MMPSPSWQDTPIVELPIYVASCPGCGSVEYIHVRTSAAGDGASFQRVVCKQCSIRYRILRERPLPCNGTNDNDGT